MVIDRVFAYAFEHAMVGCISACGGGLVSRDHGVAQNGVKRKHARNRTGFENLRSP